MRPPALRALKRLGARYDLAALQPPDPAYASMAKTAPRRPAWRALRRWCLAGLGHGKAPALPLTVAVLEPAAPKSPAQPPAPAQGPAPVPAPSPGPSLAQGALPAEAQALVQALCLERDGSLQLLACRSATARLGLRLKTKLQDITPGRQPQPGDAWDAGLLPGTAEALQALARFEPRRATLLVALGLPTPTLRAICALLHARQAHFSRPVRLLLVPATPGLQWGWPVTRIAMNRPARRFDKAR